MGYNVVMSKVLDPRQKLLISLYKDPNSETFGNLKASMLEAGFSEKHANNQMVTATKWFPEAIKNNVDMVKRAEKNLQKVLNVEIDFNDKLSVDVAKLQTDVSKFVLKSLASGKYGADQDKALPNITLNVVNYEDKPAILESVEVDK